MIVRINHAYFLPQVRTFLSDIPIDDLPCRPSFPYQFNKNLLKCRIPKVLEPIDVISGDEVKNFKRASKPNIILSNLFSCKIHTDWYLCIQRRLGNINTEK
jgi:hypothetical protein